MKTAKIKPWAQNVLKIVKMGSEPTLTSFLVKFTIQTKNNSKLNFNIKDDFSKNTDSRKVTGSKSLVSRKASRKGIYVNTPMIDIFQTSYIYILSSAETGCGVWFRAVHA